MADLDLDAIKARHAEARTLDLSDVAGQLKHRLVVIGRMGVDLEDLVAEVERLRGQVARVEAVEVEMGSIDPVVRASLAQAWDEGKRASITQLRPVNPYRAALAEPEGT